MYNMENFSITIIGHNVSQHIPNHSACLFTVDDIRTPDVLVHNITHSFNQYTMTCSARI